MIDGIWSVEIFGMYGWESIGMLMLHEGHAVGGGNHHYAVGTCTESDGQISISLTMNYKDVPRTLFGEARNKFKVVFDGNHNSKKGRLQGTIHRPRKAKMAVGCRLTREVAVPWSTQEDDNK